MRSRIVYLLTVLLFVSNLAYAENWPQWRGPNLNGFSGETDLPSKWTAEENIFWKLALPGLSGSTPIIWNDRLFLNVAEGDDLYLWCIDRYKGTLLWKKLLGNGNTKMRKQNMSSPSPVTDGKAVFVMTGTGILKGFDFSGKESWARDIQKDYGEFGLNWGYASSPLLFEDSLFVQVLHGMKTDDPSYLLRIDKKNGKTLWRVERPTPAIRESPDSYTTPTLLKQGKTAEIIVTGGDCMTGHDPATGKELWRANGLNPENNPAYRIVASPIVFDDIIYAPTRVRPLLAFKAGGRGDISTSHLLWSSSNGPDVPTPVTDGKYFYIVNDRGIVWCLDGRTGKEIYGPERIKSGTYSASPVLADGKLYITNEDGLTTVVKAGPKFEVLAENALNDYCLSSPAISNGQIFIRTSSNLYCIGKNRLISRKDAKAQRFYLEAT
ncbi:MAG TPA: PQQ-binding-like beta-propeller repeat protein [Pyrinomonadaceae bacterium]|jgi:outer membrane protein assembly factor BamB|nr:PQQ-binding-like beta-propeller repeat protein [Pyrinomonadaceae bacterium]